jgi:hypothetical protein
MDRGAAVPMPGRVLLHNQFDMGGGANRRNGKLSINYVTFPYIIFTHFLKFFCSRIDTHQSVLVCFF